MLALTAIANGFTTTWDYTTLKLKHALAHDRTCFTTTWDYTTLKQHRDRQTGWLRFTTTWDYTTLKHGQSVSNDVCCFTTTWDYTTLKQGWNEDRRERRFTTTWDYTTLKPQISKRQVFRSEKWENSPFSYGLEQHSDTTTEYPAAARRL